MNALVTGATGFAGQPLVRRLLSHGGQVTAIVRPGSPYRNSLPQHTRLTIVEADLDDFEQWPSILGSSHADVFYHLAWKDVRTGNRNDVTQVNNIEPAVKSVALAREMGCGCWIGVGSQAEYGVLNRRISEDDPVNPTTIYGASKLAACMLAQIVGRQVGIRTVWIRIFSAYGPGDRSKRLLDYVIENLLERKKPLLTAGEQLWDYIYIDDVVEALVAVALAEQASGIYNVGSGQARVLRSVVEELRDMIDPHLPLGFGEKPYKADEVMHLEADIEKIIKDTGWQPSVPLSRGLRVLVDEYMRQGRPAVRVPARE
jgi:nucleoside-diphosphate-sugar epimerase